MLRCPLSRRIEFDWIIRRRWADGFVRRLADIVFAVSSIKRLRDVMTPSRLRRLQADYDKVLMTFTDHPFIKLVQSQGEPPEKYMFEFQVKSLIPSVGNENAIGMTHRAEVFLPMDYPRRPPFCRMTTPVFHPNIDPAKICIGDHWMRGPVAFATGRAHRRDAVLSELQHQEPAERPGGGVGGTEHRTAPSGEDRSERGAVNAPCAGQNY